MPELFIPCPTCNERGVVASKEYPWGQDCPACLGRRFIRYGTESGHEHVWKWPTAVRFEASSIGINYIEPLPAICACGKSAAEVTA